MKNNNFFKLFSIFLIGLILGYLIQGIKFSSPAISAITGDSSIKVLGDKNAPIEMIEYSDFQCPFCEKFYTDTLPSILKNYVDTGKVKIVYKHFPLSIHPDAPSAALASECALEQGKFWEMHNLLFDEQNSWSGNSQVIDMYKQMAVRLGLDSEKFNQCLDTQKYMNFVNTDYQEGIAKGVRATPTFFINGQMLVGALDYSEFQNTIENLLQ